MARAALSLGLLSFLAFSPTLVSALQRGCYSDIGNLHIAMGSPFQSTGLCESHCQKSDYSVFGMRGEKCWCGDKLPLSSARVSNKECDTPCPGYPSDTCGGEDVWTIVSSSPSSEHSKSQSSSSKPKSSTSEINNHPVTMSINPTVVQTGSASQTSIPSNILTAPTMGPKDSENEIAEASALAATKASSSPSSSASSSADPESSSNAAAGPTGPASVGSVVGAVLLPLVLGSVF